MSNNIPGVALSYGIIFACLRVGDFMDVTTHCKALRSTSYWIKSVLPVKVSSYTAVGVLVMGGDISHSFIYFRF